jgi:lipopolysaccharide/colanic/teichoic acid biosynthesis glycosyltransferase
MTRLFDIVVASLGLLFLFPLLLLFAVLVKLDSPGPVFYRGRRTGRYGVEFRIFKFRTMVVDAEQVGGTSTAANDFRITRIGGFLRKYKLDELPQLLNVLKGEMSIVGPRPEVEEYTSCYDDEERIALTVRPGITDYASICFVNLGEVLGSEDADRVYVERVRPIKNQLRVKYVRERSFAGDLKIIALTVFTLVRRRPWSM